MASRRQPGSSKSASSPGWPKPWRKPIDPITDDPMTR
jgi:hypothetical protein